MKVKDIMVQPVVVVRETDTLLDVARTMLDQRIGCVPVVDARGELVGIITESDFTGRERYLPFSAFKMPQLFGEWLSNDALERIHEHARRLTAREIMTPEPVTATEDDGLTDVVQRMLHHGIHRIPVVRRRVPVGIVTRHDLLRVMAADERRR
ncbi:MAG: CBS domain-containing protein [Chloroflexi bacterium]|nr:CBS domain-containing protein [Chloroflexota bacterium]MBI4507039.1 CBS domain-containing protein [Chloroflexota bacterium]